MRAALLVGAAAWVGRASAALACGAQEEPYYEPSAQWPHGGSVPLNAPIVVALTERGGGPVEPRLAPSLTVLVHGTDDALELRAVGSAPRLVWVPAQPLSSNTTYEAHFRTGYEGAPENIWQFTTGEESAPALSLAGRMEASLEAGMEPAIVCPPLRCGCTDGDGDCLGACRNGSPEPVPQVRVTLPRAMGGFAPRVGTLWLTDGTPYDFTEPTKGTPPEKGGHVVSLTEVVSFDDEGRPTQEIRFTLPEEDVPYRPCFALRVTDERGDAAFAEPVCLKQTFPPGEGPLEGSAEEPSSTERGAGTSSGCALGVGASGSGYATLVLVALTALRRKRHASAAANGTRTGSARQRLEPQRPVPGVRATT